MRRITLMSVCFFVVLTEVIADEELRLQKRSLCASNCRNRCEDQDCAANCDSNCSRPCTKRCRNADNCQSNPVDCEPEPQEKRKDTIILQPSKQGESINKNVNNLDNDYKVDINPNITMTNTITNVNNISVPINVTSVNVNTIRFTSTDTRRTDTNITSAPENCSGSRNRISGCSENKKRIVILPYPMQIPQKQQVQVVTPPPQAPVVQTVLQQPVMMAPSIRPVIMPHQFLPPVQTQQMIVPIRVPVQTQEYYQTFAEPQIYNIPEAAPINQQQQFMWYPRQQMISQQEIIQQQQNVWPMQQNVLPMSITKPCTPFSNAPCSAQTQFNYDQPCSTPDCKNRYPYVMTSPYYGLPQFGNANNQYSSLNGATGNQFVPYFNSDQFTTTQNSNRI